MVHGVKIRNMLNNKKLVFIGAGNMAEALMGGILSSKKMSETSIGFTEINPTRVQYIQEKFKIRSFSDNSKAVSWADIILFAVKPQSMANVLSEISSIRFNDKILISIAAGIPIRFFEEKLSQKICMIRVMPNMPALVGKGVSGISRGGASTAKDEAIACEIMSAVGEIVQVPENLLDAVTAISGSGPAYFFYFMEAMIEAGIELGLSLEASSKLVEWTSLGASTLIQQTQEKPEILRRKVTSPGGTTEAAIKSFDENQTKKLIIQAIHMAEKRSKELQKGL